ncbi:DUF84 family protein [Evansella halocellulosilytica]|uniref:DUF84 family protein n=1 Tax=Evansella halocellulosilytica TaxID=2011013 RepID=UPI0027B90938|nr:DUF84 family protein [Evansella halocellulosilytica]
MMRVGIGSKNHAKVKAVKEVLKTSFQIESLAVPSSVSEQPFSDVETKQGAINRAKYLVNHLSFDIGIGLEGGVVDEHHEMTICNWGALATKEGDVFVAGGARIPLPEEIAEQLRGGHELGDVIDQWANKIDVRKNEGTVGILTMGQITRVTMFEHVVRLLVGQWQLQNQK